MDDSKEKDDFAAYKLIEIKHAVLNNKLESIEFIMIMQVMDYQYFLNHLYEITVRNKDEILLKFLIPFAEYLNRRRILKITNTFKHIKYEFLARLLILANIEEIYKVIVLDYREIPEDI